MIYTTPARRTTIIITYQGKDITADISPYLLSFTFTDNSGGKADDLAITLQDRDALWINNWQPSKSDTISASIVKYEYPETLSLPCGSFSIDQIDYSYPPATLAIKAVSADITKPIAQEKHNASWENMTLKAIAADIASKNNLALFMSTGGTGIIERIDQTEQSDLEFLKALCADYGQECKIQEGRIVIYDLEDYEAKEPVTSISSEDDRLLSVKFSSKSAKVYRKARVIYHDAVRDEDYEGEYEDDSEEGSERELVIYERAGSQSEADDLARNRLLNANRGEVTGSLSLMGDVNLVAGVMIELSGFGMFSGKHFVNKVTHKIDSSGYIATLELGMPQAEKSESKARKVKAQSKDSGSTELYYEGNEHY